MNILIIGATSAIAQAYARRVASGTVFILVGRSQHRLDAVAADLRAQGAKATHVYANAQWSKEESFEVVTRHFSRDTGDSLDVCLIAQGYLPTQETEQTLIDEVWRANTIEVSYWLYAAFQTMYIKQSGVLAVITSVAGDRGRSVNALYGASKSAISTLIEALRQRAAPYPAVRLLDIRPGPVDTPMTASLTKSLLFSSSERVGQDIDQAIRGQKEGVVYTPWWWRWVMLCLRIMPESLFFRLRF